MWIFAFSICFDLANILLDVDIAGIPFAGIPLRIRFIRLHLYICDSTPWRAAFCLPSGKYPFHIDKTLNPSP